MGVNFDEGCGSDVIRPVHIEVLRRAELTTESERRFRGDWGVLILYKTGPLSLDAFHTFEYSSVLKYMFGNYR